MRYLIAATFFLSACTHVPASDPYRHEHEALLSSSTVPSSLQPLLAEAPNNSHAVDWTRFKGGLKGLRIALDAGHVGAGDWDERSGKYAIAPDGRRLSEGLMALELARLLQTEFTKLGAVVYVDRDDRPATAAVYQDFADEPAAFFQGVDLDARRERIWAFQPDITLILHFDAHEVKIAENKNLCHETKAYVLGHVGEKELSDKVDRTLLKIAWRNPQVWRDSVDLSREVVKQIHTRDGAMLATEVTHGTRLLEPGILTRNLRLQRGLAGYVTTYLETLCYEDPGEFEKLSKQDLYMTVDGKKLAYSRHLEDLAEAIRDGVKTFIAKHAML